MLADDADVRPTSRHRASGESRHHHRRRRCVGSDGRVGPLSLVRSASRLTDGELTNCPAMTTRLHYPLAAESEGRCCRAATAGDPSDPAAAVISGDVTSDPAGPDVAAGVCPGAARHLFGRRRWPLPLMPGALEADYLACLPWGGGAGAARTGGGRQRSVAGNSR